ncbi:MAG: hypothetical protein A2Y38_26595 [Spirochaetes bacterium GWB1_59_5]|nr:MAG: hypothetical protein A2Y38_26595 [Spirochaetes bacterium GWB1_59_5]
MERLEQSQRQTSSKADGLTHRDVVPGPRTGPVHDNFVDAVDEFRDAFAVQRIVDAPATGLVQHDACLPEYGQLL